MFVTWFAVVRPQKWGRCWHGMAWHGWLALVPCEPSTGDRRTKVQLCNSSLLEAICFVPRRPTGFGNGCTGMGGGKMLQEVPSDTISTPALKHHIGTQHRSSRDFTLQHATTLSICQITSGLICALDTLKDKEYSIHRDTKESLFSGNALQLIQRDFAEIFFNPALATALGVLELLQFKWKSSSSM